MKDLNTILERIRTSRDIYDTCKLSQVAEQSTILRELSVCYSELTDHRIKAREDWMFYYFEHQGSNAAKEKYADYKIPELYLIRRTMESTKVLIDSVRSTLSSAKADNS